VKILAVSDSHSIKSSLLEAVELESPELILHLGDHNTDCAAIEGEYPEITLRSVRGNCDRFSPGPEMDEFTLDGKKFFITHGHLFGVKSGLSSIINYSISCRADIVLFGHTHIPHYSVRENLTLINPGSITFGEKTYAILDFKNGIVSCEIKSLNNIP